ncbi:E3 ubiquitin-protein ligase Zswim2-like [Diadema antillarum]|uniref:E3 ubiquitin-protein ligase Zswim2-like n=1 Tax=Diadema antillarum TaxID=105358 RepID=UPI003A89E97F
MAIRSVLWQRTVSDAVSWHQDEAQSATIYILRETGPTGFLLKEEGESKKIKVLLGDPHKCTCSVFLREKELCKHICWVLLKKFRVDRHNPLSFQKGLVEREINEVLRGLAKREDPRRRAAAERIARTAARQGNAYQHSDGREILEQREITEEDVCPICQDELLGNREPVTYCRFGCAKSIHIKCMKVWADHQKSTGETVLKCPLCREDFGQIDILEAEYRNASLQKTRAERADIHMGIACDACNQSPISGKCYKCTTCPDYHLCQNCFSANAHMQHSFQFRQKSSQRWRPAQRGSGGALPSAVMSDLQNREITDEDYDTLLQLDSQAANQVGTVPEHIVKSFPVETVRDGSGLLSLGTQCRVCLRSYSVGQLVRKLPCRHKFHASCIDQWLLHEHPTCPVDGTVVWNPVTGAVNGRRPAKKKPKTQTDRQGGPGESQPVLEIPGLGVVKLAGRDQGSRRARPGTLGGGHLADRGSDATGEAMGLGAGFQLTGAGISSRAISHPSPSQQRRGGNSQSSSRRDERRRQGGMTVEPSSALNLGSNRRVPSHEDLINHIASANAVEYSAPEMESVLTRGALDRLQIGNASESTNHKPPSGSGGSMIGHRPPVPPTATERTRTHVASIPLPREEAMTPIGLHHHGSSSAPSGPSGRNAPSENGGASPISVKERGRVARRPAAGGRRTRSSSTGRARSGSRDRHQQGSAGSKLEALETLFLGSPSGQLLGASKPPSGQPSSSTTSGHHPRSKVKTGPTRTPPTTSADLESAAMADLALAGNALHSLHLSGLGDDEFR